MIDFKSLNSLWFLYNLLCVPSLNLWPINCKWCTVASYNALCFKINSELHRKRFISFRIYNFVSLHYPVFVNVFSRVRYAGRCRSQLSIYSCFLENCFHSLSVFHFLPLLHFLSAFHFLYFFLIWLWWRRHTMFPPRWLQEK